MNATTSRFLAVLSAVALLVCSCEKSDGDGSTSIVAPSSSSSSAPASATSTQATATPAKNSSAPAASSSASSTTAKNTAQNTNTSAKETTQSAANETTASSSAIAQRSLPVQPASSTTDTGVPGDKVSFGSLIWSFGGIDGTGSVASGVSISGLSFGPGSLSFRYNRDMSAWGYGPGTLVYACLFVKNNNGDWVGGKFDWISSNRANRDLKNVLGGYSGWNLSNVPNPCQAAFFILDKNKQRRSNVLVSTWKR